MTPLLHRIWKWWRAPYRREQRMLVLQGTTLDMLSLLLSRQRITMTDISKIEIALDAAALKLATTQADVTALVGVTSALANTALQLADAVRALKADAPKTDLQADIDRLQGKAEGLVALVGDVDATLKTVAEGAAAAEDRANDVLEVPAEGEVLVVEAPAVEVPVVEAPVVEAPVEVITQA